MTEKEIGDVLFILRVGLPGAYLNLTPADTAAMVALWHEMFRDSPAGLIAAAAKTYNWNSDTVAAMLENELYIGNTLNMKYSTKSYKDRRRMEHPRDECMVIEGSHEPIIDRETWNIVQRARQNRRRPTKMEELNKYSGLVVCAGCGSVMVLHRAHTMSASYNHFTCRTYKKEGAEVCTAHYIREQILDEVVLEDIRRVTARAREHPQEFRGVHQREAVRRASAGDPREGEGADRPESEGQGTDAIFKRLYEDSVLGRITAEQFPDSLWQLHGGDGRAEGEDPGVRSGHPSPAGAGVRRRPLHCPGEEVHRHPGTDPGAAAAVYSEDRGA